MKYIGLQPIPTNDDAPRPGLLVEGGILDLPAVLEWGYAEGLFEYNLKPGFWGRGGLILSFLHNCTDQVKRVYETVKSRPDLYAIRTQSGDPIAWQEKDATIGEHIDILFLRGVRDFYSFEQHVKTANEHRGREVPKEWYQFPVFYYSNARIFDSGKTVPYPSYSHALDYELEVACVIGKPGRDIPADKAEDCIFGYTIFNDWSARDVQAQEMRVGLGPAKGKDFANSFGPYLVTPDELADRHIGRPGVYDLEMIARVNGVEKSRGNWKDLYWSFGQMIERASQDVTLQPGDVIGSGTVGTGCLLELTKGDGPWLQPGDVVELEIERLGILRNVIGEKREKRDS
jgi:fumarylacetoacetate (FAA) hydrolase